LLVDLENSGVLGQIISLASKSQYSALASLIFSPSVFYPILILLGSAAVIAIIVTILATGLTLSSEYTSYRRALEGKTVGIGEALYAVKDRWRAMAWTNLLSLFVTYLPVVLAFLGIGYAIYSSQGSVFAALWSLGFVFIGGLSSLILSFFTMYSTVAVAIDNTSGFTAIRRSFQRSGSYFGVSFVYALVRLSSIIAIGAIGLLSSLIGLPLSSLASIIVTLIIVPVLHLAKTTIYREIGAQEPMREFRPLGQTTSAMSDLFRGAYARYLLTLLRRGLSALGRYVFSLKNVPYHISSTLAFLIGVYAGSYVAVHGLVTAIFTLGYKSGQVNPTILRAVPLSEGFDIFFHNWSVSLSTALSGLWLVAPSLLTLSFNGVILGVVYYLTPSATMFVAAIFPHGIIELPAFIIAGSAGMKLGVSFVRTFGRPKSLTSRDAMEKAHEEILEHFYEVARNTIYVLIGLTILFLVAGFIEGNITPIIMRATGWH